MKKPILFTFFFLMFIRSFALTLSGTVTYANTNSTPFDNVVVELFLNDNFLSSTITDCDGEYSFTGLSDGDYEVFASSTKAWCGVNSADALRVLQHFAGTNYLTGIYLLAGDVNGDGYVNSMDALTIANRYTGNITSFTVGDWLFDTGTVTLNGSNITYDFQGLCFGDVNGSNIPFKDCGCLIMNYGGEDYPTILIGSQCWMTKNLNIGAQILGANDQTDNDTIEKYCYLNNVNNCITYGGLYQWDEMMQYASSDSQGICPSGWHIPSDQDWCVLTSYLDNTVNCSAFGYSGTDCGTILKENGSSGFEAKLGGRRLNSNTFDNISLTGYFWTSTGAGGSTFFRAVSDSEDRVLREYHDESQGHSVRCIKDVSDNTCY